MDWARHEVRRVLRRKHLCYSTDVCLTVFGQVLSPLPYSLQNDQILKKLKRVSPTLVLALPQFQTHDKAVVRWELDQPKVSKNREICTLPVHLDEDIYLLGVDNETLARVREKVARLT